MIEVKSGSRIFKFDGECLSTSSSQRESSVRWVEFALYKTVGGQYVISRVGQSVIYHVLSCTIAQRNDLEDCPRSELSDFYVPCPECRPDESTLPMVAPERPRPWALVCEDAEKVVEALYRDEGAGRFMTRVASNLLELAARKDPRIADAYFIETIS